MEHEDEMDLSRPRSAACMVAIGVDTQCLDYRIVHVCPSCSSHFDSDTSWIRYMKDKSSFSHCCKWLFFFVYVVKMKASFIHVQGEQQSWIYYVNGAKKVLS